MVLASFALLVALQSTPPAAEPPAPPAPAAEPTTPEQPATAPPPVESPKVEPEQQATEKPEPTKPEPTKPEPTKPGAQAGEPTEQALPAETPKRAYIVIDRVSVASGHIESDSEAVIVVRDDKGRVKSFAKNRVVSVTYLLEGPSGRRVRVYFHDGNVVVANLIEDGFEHVAVEIAGIKTRYPRESVVAVRPYPTDRELYERFRTTLEPDQYAARYTLALWLYNKKMYPESQQELESLLEATNHYEAKRLLKEVNAQVALMEGSGGPSDRPRESGAGTENERERRPGDNALVSSPLLSDAEVNLIRVYELDTANPPRLQVSPSLIKTMLEKYADNELIPAKKSDKDAFYSKSPIDIVKTLFALKARDLYGEIKVIGEPDSLAMFRQRVHNAWLIGNCATSRCHGGADGGRFFLHNRDWKDENIRYTNLLILQRTRIDTLPLIDPEKPTDSLLFQYALPKTEARRPHPDVRGWTPMLSSGKRGLQEDFIDWVRSMRLPRGDYPIEFTPPALKVPDRPSPGGPDR